MHHGTVQQRQVHVGGSHLAGTNACSDSPRSTSPPTAHWIGYPDRRTNAIHDAVIMGPRWVIDGNYSRVLPERLQRATGFVLLDVPTLVSLYRYIRRCWFERDRRGALEGGRDSVKWEVIHHIAVATRANRSRYERMFGDIHLPKVRLASQRALAEFYSVNGLRR